MSPECFASWINLSREFFFFVKNLSRELKGSAPHGMAAGQPEFIFGLASSFGLLGLLFFSLKGPKRRRLPKWPLKAKQL